MWKQKEAAVKKSVNRCSELLNNIKATKLYDFTYNNIDKYAGSGNLV